MSRPAFVAALGEGPKGLRLDLFVSPGAPAARFPDRYDPWRKRIGIRVQSPAQKGRANREVIRLVARFFDTDERGVQITHGTAHPLKTLLVDGLSLRQATTRLSGAIQ